MNPAGAATARSAARPPCLWIAWERHRRTLELCRFLGITPTLFASSLPRWLKHPWFALRTGCCLLRQRPAAVVVQNPSVVLTLIACLLRPVVGYRLVVDAHNAGIRPDHPLLQRLPGLYRYLQRRADLTVVTNPGLAETVRRNGGTPLCLPDRLPRPPKTRPMRLKGEKNVVFICTFGSDEPYREALAAADRLPPEVHLYVTGNYRKLGPAAPTDLSARVTLTGFLPEAEYWDLLAAADLVMDLTTRQDCLVCGAYEAVALGTPLVLTNTPALRAYFRRGAVFTANTPEAIAEAIGTALASLPGMHRGIAELKKILQRSWAEKGEAFRHFLLEGR